MTRALAIVLTLVACSSRPAAKHPDDDPNWGRPQDAQGPAKDSRTPLEQRRDAGCTQLGPRLTACAVEDAKADLAAGKTTQKQFDQDTAAAVQSKNTQQFVDKCEASQMSSRQVRVLEVCFKQAPDCGELRRCLANLQPDAK